MKPFLPEEGREVFVEFVSSSARLATSRLAYVECQAAFARAHREGRLDRRELAVARRGFEQMWRGLAVVELNAGVSATAAELLRSHNLRAGDAIHLASAASIGSPGSVRLACWDRRLWEAAARDGFTMVPGARP